MGMRKEFNFRWDNAVKIRCCKYLNNIVEQDHRRVKFRVSAMLGFKSFRNARIVIAGIELIQKLKNGQYGVPYSSGDSSLDIWTNVLAAWRKRRCNRTASGQVSRLLKRLRLHGIIKKVGHTYKYYLTEFGKHVTIAGLKLRELVLIPHLAGTPV
jgi:hypothetical protein